MTASQRRAQRGVNPCGASLDNVGASHGVADVVVLDAVIEDDFARRRADNSDGEAGHYRHWAIQEERALGPGYYYVDLLRDMAADRAAMAQRIRTGNGNARDPAIRRVAQPPSQSPVRNPQSTDRRTHQHLRHDSGR
jgi:hypothetical protein